MPIRPIAWRVIAALAAVKLILHLLTNVNYGLHRDAYLYLALGRHLDWGYWSNPPLIGWISWFTQNVFGTSMFEVRLVPTLFGTAILIITCLMAREMGGGKYAQLLTGLSVLLSPSFIRSSWLFQPVIVDLFFWTLASYFIVRYLRSEDKRNLFWFGITFGIGFLNKYNIAFLLIALIPALLITPYRRVLWRRETLWAALIAFILISPNLIWQYQHDFPVVTHMRELARNQLVNVSAFNFLLDQFFINFSCVLIWIPGLIFLLANKHMQRFRAAGWTFVFTILIFLILHGKSYYTMGIYPIVIAAGAVFWEQAITNFWFRVALPMFMALLLMPILPLGIPFLSVPKMAAYCKYLVEKIGLDGPVRWEDGQLHTLPQDYADMIGWDELARHAANAYQQAEDKQHTLLYCENYGQAGAIESLNKNIPLPPVTSFSDAYRLWMPRETDANTLIYVNDELGEDVQALFADIKVIGKIENPYAREYGTTVYLCQKPRQNFSELWKRRVQEVLSGKDD